MGKATWPVPSVHRALCPVSAPGSRETHSYQVASSLTCSSFSRGAGNTRDLVAHSCSPDGFFSPRNHVPSTTLRREHLTGDQAVEVPFISIMCVHIFAPSPYIRHCGRVRSPSRSQSGEDSYAGAVAPVSTGSGDRRLPSEDGSKAHVKWRL